MSSPKLIDKEAVLNDLRRVRIELFKEHPKLKTLLFMGVSGNEGVSSLATTFALDCVRNAQLRVALVDMHKDTSEIRKLLDEAKQKTSGAIPNFYSRTDIQADSASSQPVFLQANLTHIIDTHELVVFDAPVLGQNASTAELAGLVDGVLIVVEANKTFVDEISLLRERLERANACIIGAFVNRQGRFMPNMLWSRLCGRLGIGRPAVTC